MRNVKKYNQSYHAQNSRTLTDKAIERYWADPETHRQKAREHSKTIAGRFSGYKAKAKERKLVFELTVEEFDLLTQQACWYCENADSPHGIDRVDNADGYTWTNSVSCCYRCNAAKSALTMAEFLEMCKKVARRFGNLPEKPTTYKVDQYHEEKPNE